MEKSVFDFVEKQYGLECDLYFKLDKLGISMEIIEDELLYDFVDSREKYLKIGKYLDKEKYINKDTYMLSEYEDIERYIKLHVIYEYENGMALCTSTAESLCLVPIKLLANV